MDWDIMVTFKAIMDLTRFPTLQAYFADRLADASTDPDERAQLENFALDERPAAESQQTYNGHLGTRPLTTLDSWQNRHNRVHLKKELQLDLSNTRRPLTFRPENDANRLPRVGPNLYLVRLEGAAWPCSLLAGASPEKVRAAIKTLDKDDGKSRDYLQRLSVEWNRQRDQRPQYATTWEEVDDILADETSPDWAEHLRDRLGLGDYDPGAGGEPIPVLLMRYTVAEASAVWEGQGHPAVPTMLDGPLSRFFYPTPIPALDCHEAVYGHTLNLAPVAAENDYSMGVELLHPRFDYRPGHFYRVGYIKRPIGLSLEKARSFHLPWLRLRYGRDDFGVAS
jgi:hypothetical protein